MLNMAKYLIGDIHNSLQKFEPMLELISPSAQDHVILLGDLFDRGGAKPDPVGVYFKILGLSAKVTWIRGNHDQLLAEYIVRYFETPEKKRQSLRPYPYNSFDLMRARLVPVDLLELADTIRKLPLQAEAEIGTTKYLLAHAMTFDPAGGGREAKAYLEGAGALSDYSDTGVDGYVSLVGHRDSSYQCGNPKGSYLDGQYSVWRNERGNVFMMDCGCGLPNGRLACMCLETGERFYV